MNSFCRCGLRLRELTSTFVYCPRCSVLTQREDDDSAGPTLTGHKAQHLMAQVEALLNQGMKILRGGSAGVGVSVTEGKLLGDEDVEPSVHVDIADPLPEAHFINLAEEHPVPQLAKAADYRRHMEDRGCKMTECVRCDYPVEDKCGAVCPACKTIQPCGSERL